jgi:hypothetical protein
MVNKFAETVGMEKATDLIEETCQTVGLSEKSEFNKAEALQILEVLRQKGGMLGIIAGFMAAEAHLMKE